MSKRKETNKYKYRFVSETHKECSLCTCIKPLEDFHKDKNNIKGLGRAFYCKQCANEKGRLWHKENKHNQEAKQKRKNQYRKRVYGLTLLECIEKLKAQNNTCAICKVELLQNDSNTHLDHCHKTGKIRAFLCTNCNRGLGHFMDSPNILQNAITYLNHHNSDVA